MRASVFGDENASASPIPRWQSRFKSELPAGRKTSAFSVRQGLRLPLDGDSWPPTWTTLLMLLPASRAATPPLEP